MAKTSGGLRGRASLRNTISVEENAIRYQKKEHAVVISSNGQVLQRTIGSEHGVGISSRAKNAIVTHNHPSDYGTFSREDLINASKLDVKEMRAVSRNYTYSIQKPRNGWPDPDKINEIYRKVSRKYMDYTGEYVRKYRSRAAIERSSAYMEGIIRDIARELGFKYTRKRRA